MKLKLPAIIPLCFLGNILCCGFFQFFNYNVHLKNVSFEELTDQGVFRAMVPTSASKIYILGCRNRGSRFARFQIDDTTFRTWASEKFPQATYCDIPEGGKEFTNLYEEEPTKIFSRHIRQGWFAHEEYSEDSGLEIVFDSATNTGYVSWC
jgi:hypothetical protein